MDQELKQFLEAMEARTNARLDTMEARTNVRFDALEKRIDASGTQMKAEIEKVETKLLSAFHGWARSMEIRVRGISTTTTGLEERMSYAEERISELERKRAS